MVLPFFCSLYCIIHNRMAVSVRWLQAKLTKFEITNEIGVHEVIHPETH